MQLQTYRDVVRAFRTRPEAKSVGADGRACGRQMMGLLQRRVVIEMYVAHVGKEANKLEEVEGGWSSMTLASSTPNTDTRVEMNGKQPFCLICHS